MAGPHFALVSKKDVLVELFGLVWLPHYLVEVDGELMELPAFSTE